MVQVWKKTGGPGGVNSKSIINIHIVAIFCILLTAVEGPYNGVHSIQIYSCRICPWLAHI